MIGSSSFSKQKYSYNSLNYIKKEFNFMLKLNNLEHLKKYNYL